MPDRLGKPLSHGTMTRDAFISAIYDAAAIDERSKSTAMKASQNPSAIIAQEPTATSRRNLPATPPRCLPTTSLRLHSIALTVSNLSISLIWYQLALGATHMPSYDRISNDRRIVAYCKMTKGSGLCLELRQIDAVWHA